MRPWMYLLSALVAVPSLPSCREEPSTAIIVALSVILLALSFVLLVLLMKRTQTSAGGPATLRPVRRSPGPARPILRKAKENR